MLASSERPGATVAHADRSGRRRQGLGTDVHAQGAPMHERRTKVRRLRIALGVLAALTLVATGVLGGVATALNWDGLLTPGPSWDDRYTITSYEVVGTLQSDGTFSVIEDIEVVWHEPRRGLIRDIDRSAPDGREMAVEDVEVTSDTQDDVWFEVRVDDTAGHDSVHLGEQFEFRPLGSDHYRIAYDLEGLLVEWDGIATLRWDTFGDQWTTLIEQATVTLELPDGAHGLACVVGARGEAFACDGDGPAWSAKELRPGRGITVEAQLAPGTIDPDTLPSADLDPLEEFSHVALQRLGLIAGLTGAAALPLLGSIGAPASRRRRDEARQRVETTGAAYAPPREMRPLTAGYLVRGESIAANDDQLFAAWLLDAQQRDLIQVEPRGKGFRARLTGRGTPDNEPEADALRALVPTSSGWVTWDKKTSQSQRTSFEKAWQGLRSHHEKQARVPSFVSARVGPAGGVMAAVALLAALLLLRLTPVGSIALVVGLLGAWGASTYTDHTLRTAVAYIPDDRLELWRQLEGLRRFVSEAHADQISGLADDPNVPLDSPFLELLPWVIAFGCGDRWAERFDAQIRSVTETRGFYAPVRTRDISSARSVAKPQSSSSGSGGSSGVGSGGGGGGGSSR
jgi:uncharacterized membrane protein YgcG